jgi:beta-hydroxylase
MKAFHDGTVKVTDLEKEYGLNKVFGYVYQFRLKAKALKASNRGLYYFLKWFIMLGLFFLIFIRPYVF